MLRLPALALLITSAGTLIACSVWIPDFVEQQSFVRVGRIDRVAMVPFYPSARLSQAAGEGGLSAADASDLVTRFVSEAVGARVPVIPATDVQLAFEGHGQVTPRNAPEAAALLVAGEFGADALMLGEVRRYRERVGSAVGSAKPASVEFEVTLYEAPSGTKLWVARFNHTQAALTSNFFDSARLPGRGTRFLTVAELARFGAERIAEELPLGRR